MYWASNPLTFRRPHGLDGPDHFFNFVGRKSSVAIEIEYFEAELESLYDGSSAGGGNAASHFLEVDVVVAILVEGVEDTVDQRRRHRWRDKTSKRRQVESGNELDSSLAQNGEDIKLSRSRRVQIS